MHKTHTVAEEVDVKSLDFFSYIRSPKNIIEHQFGKFLLVGVINTLFGYLAYALCIFLGIHYSVAIIIATVAGTLFNFKTIGILVFENHNNALIFRFSGVYIIYYFLDLGGLIALHHYTPNRYLAQAILVFPLALISFYLNRNFVFKPL